MTAKRLGGPLGLSSPEMNQLLAAQGILKGEPSNWLLTAKGSEFATVKDLKNGSSAGYVAYDPAILEVLDTSADAITAAKVATAARRVEMSEQLIQGRTEAQAQFQAFQQKKLAAEAPFEVDWKKLVLIAVGVAVVIGGTWLVSTYGPPLKDKWRARRERRREEHASR